MVSIRSISDDMSILTYAALRLLPSWQHDIIWIWRWACTSQQPFNFIRLLQIINQWIMIISMCCNYARLNWCWIVTGCSWVTHRRIWMVPLSLLNSRIKYILASNSLVIRIAHQAPTPNALIPLSLHIRLILLLDQLIGLALSPMTIHLLLDFLLHQSISIGDQFNSRLSWTCLKLPNYNLAISAILYLLFWICGLVS